MKKKRSLEATTNSTRVKHEIKKEGREKCVNKSRPKIIVDIQNSFTVNFREQIYKCT